MRRNFPNAVNYQIILFDTRGVREIAFNGCSTATCFPASGYLLFAKHVVDGGTIIDFEMFNLARFGGVDTDAFLFRPTTRHEMG